MVYTATVTKIGKRPGKLSRFETVAMISCVKDQSGKIVLNKSSVPVGRLICKIKSGTVIKIVGEIKNGSFGYPKVEVIE